MTSYADRPWVRMYDQDVPSTLAPYPNKALHDLLREAAVQYPDDEFLLTSVRVPIIGRIGSHMSMAKLDRASDALGAALLAMGLNKGDRVAIILPTCVAFAIAYYAVLKAGGVVAACNPTYPPTTMAEQINDCDARIAIVLSGIYPSLKQVQPHTQLDTIIVANIKEYFPTIGRWLFSLAREKSSGQYLARPEAGDVWLQGLLKQYDGQAPAVAVSGSDLAIYQYTGGTTGIGKGAMLSHGALVANIHQIKAFASSLRRPGERWTVLGALPMFHVYGMVVVLSLSASERQRIALAPNPRDVDELVDIIARYRPDNFPAVPAMLNAIANHPRVKSGKVSLKSIKYCGSGSAPLASAPQDDFEKLLDVPIRQGFGISEASCSTHMQPTRSAPRKGSVGVPLPDIDARIVNLADGQTDVPVGERGELILAGPNLMRGYHNMAAETGYALREMDGKTWLFTGDIATMDENGYFYIVDRKKDMGIIGGFKVYPANIERVLKMHSTVMETIVVSIPHPTKEGLEAVKAWVVFRPGQSATEQELIDHCQQFLAPYEVPRRYAFVERLPGEGFGKALRVELIQQEMKERDGTS